MKSKSATNKKDRKLLISILGILSLLTIFNTYAIIAYTRHFMRTNDGTFNQLVIQATDRLHKPAIIEPTTGNLYFPQAKLKLPPTIEKIGSVVYFYKEDTNGINHELHLANTNDIESAKVPVISNRQQPVVSTYIDKLQSCSRGIRILFAASTESKYASSKLLKDGRTIYFYEEDKCKNQDFLDYVKKIESF